MQYFATQLSNHQQTTRSHRAAQYRKQKKHGPDNDHEVSSATPEPDSLTPKAFSLASHTPLEIAQLRTAGLLPEDDDKIPPAPFPHAQSKVKPRNYSSKVQEELARPPINLYVPNVTAKGQAIETEGEGTSLKNTHLNVLTTVMHRCLLQGDYDRAGRAWGMLLRTRVAGGDLVDPRNHARWGVGAEILLRRRDKQPSAHNISDEIAQHDVDLATFSEEGFERAREYYERLLIQYPNRKLHPNNIDERTFYPAMFSLWILEISERSKRKRRRLEVDFEESRSMSAGDLSHEEQSELDARGEEILEEELTQATELTERLNQLISSPPFDKQVDLLQLRGHVALWMSSLVVGNARMDDDWDMESTQSIGEDSSEITSQQKTRLLNSQKELLQAETFFQRAEANGGSRQAGTKAALQLKLKEIARQLAKHQNPNDEF